MNHLDLKAVVLDGDLWKKNVVGIILAVFLKY